METFVVYVEFHVASLKAGRSQEKARSSGPLVSHKIQGDLLSSLIFLQINYFSFGQLKSQIMSSINY